MLWSYAAEKSKSLRLGYLGIVLTGLLSSVPSVVPIASAAGTQIDVSICGTTAPSAAVDVSEPINDSVVSRPDVTFRGTLANTSQLEVLLDGQYTSTVAIPANGSTFAFDMTLPLGTHTVTVTANAICGGASAKTSTVLTYQPATEPSSGVTTPTTLDDAQSGVVLSQDQLTKDDTESIDQIPVLGGIINNASDAARTIGLDSTLAGSGSPAAVGIARVGLTVIAVTSVVMATSLAPLAIHAAPGVSEVFHLGTHRSLIYLEWAIRGLGALAMALAYFL